MVIIIRQEQQEMLENWESLWLHTGFQDQMAVKLQHTNLVTQTKPKICCLKYLVERSCQKH